MIITKLVEITVGPRAKTYSDLGYGDIKPGQKLLVSPLHLGLKSDAIVSCQCDSCPEIFDRKIRTIRDRGKTFNDPILCIKCSRKVATKNCAANLKHHKGEKHGNWNPNKKALAAYGYKVRQITEKTYAENEKLINPHGLPRTLCGVEGGYQLDHKVSIKKGFMFGINPIVMGSLDNLQMLSWSDNRNKHY